MYLGMYFLLYFGLYLGIVGVQQLPHAEVNSEPHNKSNSKSQILNSTWTTRKHLRFHSKLEPKVTPPTHPRERRFKLNMQAPRISPNFANPNSADRPQSTVDP